MSLGAIDVLPKPLDANIFLNLVHQICTSRDQYILLVDDNIDFLTAMKHLLIVEGFKAETASSGEEALEKIKAQIPALVFIDLIMPGMDGFELVERISKNPSWEKIPIAILSGKELTNEDRQRLDRHIRNFLNKKDLSQTELVKTIKNLLINQHKT